MKTLVIGWDAATIDHISNLDCELSYWHSLPHGGTLVADSPFGEAGYVSSANAWTTLTTGATFDEHGILGFVFNEYTGHRYEDVIRRLATVQSLPPLLRRILIGRVLGMLGADQKGVAGEKVDSTAVTHKRVWEYLDHDALIYGLPLTYPVWETNGILVSGIPGPKPAQATHPVAYPEQIAHEVYENENAGYYIETNNPINDSASNTEQYCDEYQQQIMANATAYMDLYDTHRQEYDFEFGFLMLRALDSIMHATTDESILADAYETVDAATARVVSHIDPDHVLILSDHGMRSTSVLRTILGAMGLGKPVKMDHDAAAGVWRGSEEFAISRHSDVTPAILETMGISEQVPSPRQQEHYATSADDREEIHERLEDLGYA